MPPTGTTTHSLSRKASAPSSLASPKIEQSSFSGLSNEAASAMMPTSLVPPGPGVPAMPSPTPVGAGAADVRDVLQRRISSFVYLKRTLLGKNVWLGTVRLSRREIEAMYDVERMRRRAQRALHMGQSLASLLDIPSLPEFAKAIIAVVVELDALDDGQPIGGKAVRNFFRGTVRQKRGAGGIDFEGISLSPSGAASSTAEAGWLQGSHIPFVPDFYQTFLTLLDLLTEVYHKLLQHVPLPAPGGAGSSGYFTTTSTSSDNGPGSSLAPGETISAANQELILKVDGKLKKIPMQVSKEIDSLARHLLKQELDSLDPMMRELANDDRASLMSAGGSSIASSTLIGSVSSSTAGSSTVGYASSTRSPSLHNASETMSLGRGGGANLLRSPVSDDNSWSHGTTIQTPTSASVGSAQSQRQTRQFNPATVSHGIGLSNVGTTEWGEHARAQREAS